jgi:hypothetical protein
MICPRCKSEYREGYTYCYDCGVPLLDPADPGEPDEAGETSQPLTGEHYEIFINSKMLECPVCSATHFHARTDLFPAKGVINYICIECGYIFWFADMTKQYLRRWYGQPANLETEIDNETSPAFADECPICFHKRSSADKECSYCGHRFEDR